MDIDGMSESVLMDEISQWPDWKINSLMLDESDLKLKEQIMEYREKKGVLKMINISEIVTLSDVTNTIKAIKKLKGRGLESFICELKSSIPNDIIGIMVDNMTQEQLLGVYETYLKNLDIQCDHVIEMNTGIKRIPNGTSVKVMHDFNPIKTGTIVKIISSLRYEEDTFGQGWYSYQVEDSDGNKTTLYQNEFTLLT